MLQALQMVIPELFVVRQPVAHWSELSRDKMISPFTPMPLLRHQAGIQQDAKMLRDRRSAHLEMPGKDIDGSVRLDKQIQHPATRRMADRSKHIRFMISDCYHAASIGKRFLTSQVGSLEFQSACFGVDRSMRNGLNR